MQQVRSVLGTPEAHVGVLVGVLAPLLVRFPDHERPGRLQRVCKVPEPQVDSRWSSYLLHSTGYCGAEGELVPGKSSSTLCPLASQMNKQLKKKTKGGVQSYKTTIFTAASTD